MQKIDWIEAVLTLGLMGFALGWHQARQNLLGKMAPAVIKRRRATRSRDLGQ